jgi:hypothetical protein
MNIEPQEVIKEEIKIGSTGIIGEPNQSTK